MNIAKTCLFIVGSFMCADGIAQAQPFFPQPSYPVYISPSTITGMNPWGGWNSSGVTVNNTALDPFRQQSMNNGSLQNVSRPVYNSFGQIVGYKTGQQWVNSVTGQTHFQGQVMTNNGIGGTNTQTVLRSMPEPKSQPKVARPQTNVRPYSSMVRSR